MIFAKDDEHSSSPAKTAFQNNLMSPPMTPKVIGTNGPAEEDNNCGNNTTKNDNHHNEHVEHESMTHLSINDNPFDQPPFSLSSLLTKSPVLTPSSSVLDRQPRSSSCYRKAGLSRSIATMTQVNRDTLNMTGLCFSIPFQQQQIQLKRQQSPSQRRRSHRTKSLPRRSPTLTTSTPGVFTLNVFDRPPPSSHTVMPYNRHHQRRQSRNDTQASSSFYSSAHLTSLDRKTAAAASSSPVTSSLTSPPASPSSLPSSWIDTDKPKADTFFYDHDNLSVDNQDMFDSSWLPSWDSFDKRSSIRVVWKGSPLAIHQLPYYDQLHPNEQSIASTLRLTPEQYLKCKRALILSAKVFYDHGLPFRKSDAQKVCRIDVNKTSCLWGAFNRLGWLHPRSSSLSPSPSSRSSLSSPSSSSVSLSGASSITQ